MSLLRVLRKHGQEAAQAAGEHGAESSGPMSIDELPDFIQHHIGDATEIEFGGGHWSLEALSIDPIHIGSVAIALSPHNH